MNLYELLATLGDCCKLTNLGGVERLAVLAIGYEHDPPRIDLTPLVLSFEVIAREVLQLKLSERIETRHNTLVHPVQRCVRVFGWEVFSRRR